MIEESLSFVLCCCTTHRLHT